MIPYIKRDHFHSSFKILNMSYFLFLIIFLIQGAKIEKNQHSYSFEIDNEVGYQSSYAFLDEKMNEYIRIINIPGNNYLEIYNLKNGQLKQRFSYENLSRLASFYRLQNNEFILYDSFLREFFKVNGNNIQSFYKEGEQIIGDFETYNPEMRNNPIFVFNNQIGIVKSFIRLYRPIKKDNIHREKGLVHYLDLNIKKTSLSIPLPALLDTVDFGKLNRFTSTINKDQLIIAPSYSNEFIIVNLKNNNFISPIVDKSQYYQVVKPYANMKNTIPDNEEFFTNMNKHYYENSYYVGILYDSFRSLYYRFLIERTSPSQTNYKILVFDSKFKLLKTHPLSEDYKLDGMFVSSKGLNLLNYKKYKMDTNKLIFDSFIF